MISATGEIIGTSKRADISRKANYDGSLTRRKRIVTGRCKRGQGTGGDAVLGARPVMKFARCVVIL
jgi:hypothetical protein